MPFFAGRAREPSLREAGKIVWLNNLEQPFIGRERICNALGAQGKAVSIPRGADCFLRLHPQLGTAFTDVKLGKAAET